MKLTTRILLMTLMLLPAAASAQTRTDGGATLPRWNIKTNLVQDATASMNLGVEFRTGAKTSLDIPVTWNPFEFSDNRKWKHILVQPEFRWWTKETFNGHFFGLHGHYAYYNVGNLPKPFSPYMRDHRFEGWLAGVGASYGYRWNFNEWLGLEATVGVGYAYMEYDRYRCENCGERLGSNETKHYFGPTKVGLNLIFAFGGGKNKPQPVVPVYVPPVAQPTPEPAAIVIYEPTIAAGFVTPEVEAVKVRNESGAASFDFAVGKTEIDPNFRNNAAELQKVHRAIEDVRNNPDFTITGIVITGYASPEGTSASNQSLSERRAQSLKHQIGTVHHLPDNLFGVNGAGEDWNGLDALVSQSMMADKYRALEIIRSTDVLDVRERKLMALSGGAPYRQMKADMYPQLRRIEYRLDYTVNPFTVEQGKEVMKLRPGNLSLNEMFLIANTYAPGSNEFNEVFETAARVFPDSDTANLNAAASALQRKDTASAIRHLEKVKRQDAAYWNNMGVLAWLQGDKAKAADCFAKAGGAQAASNAAELTRHLKSIILKILTIKTTKSTTQTARKTTETKPPPIPAQSATGATNGKTFTQNQTFNF